MAKPEERGGMMRFLENEWGRYFGGKLEGRLLLTRVQRVCEVLDKDGEPGGLAAVGGDVPIPTAAKLLLSALSDTVREARQACEQGLSPCRQHVRR